MSGYLRGSALPHVRAVALASMPDVCVRQAATGSTTLDSYGQPTTTYPDDATFPCGLDMLTATEQLTTGTNDVVLSARLRFPLGVPLAAADKVRITQHYDTAVSWVFEVVGDVDVGATAQRVDLRRVRL